MRINEIPVEGVLRSLVTTENGLSDHEADRRLREFGQNEISEIRKTPLWRSLIGQFTHFLAVLLWIGAGLAFVSEWLRPGEGMMRLGVAIVCVIFINAIFTFIQEYKAEKSIEKLRQMLPFRVKVMRAAEIKELSAAEIVPGDLIIIGEGDKVPADARIIQSSYISVNNAPLTGESQPVSLTSNPHEGELIESNNIAFAGTTVLSGSARAVVFATGMRTEFGRIAHLTAGAEPELSPLQKEIVNITRIIAVIAVSIGVIFFAIGHFIGIGFWENFIFAVGIIVANVPEGLLPTVTLSLAMGSQRMAKKNALIKTLTAVETLGSVTVICTDKTGTLTQNKMKVKTLWQDNEFYNDDNIDAVKHRALLNVARCCNNASIINGQYKGDPTETALLKSAIDAIGEPDCIRITEMPFDSDRKRMTVMVRQSGATYVFTKGAVEGILPLCSAMNNKGEVSAMTDRSRAEITDAFNDMMDNGLRVLGFAFRQIDNAQSMPPDELERDLEFAGLIGLEDPPRPEVKAAVQKCRDAGIRVIMITGDAGRVALSIAKEIGLARSGSRLRIMDGAELNSITDVELWSGLSHFDLIFARMTPKHKNRIVRVLKENGERVAVTGDGVNDAPALKHADIGIAMGLTGTDVAKESADMILLDDNFATIVSAIEEGRAVFENIRKFICYIFSSNIPEVVPYLAYVIFRVPLPLTIMQILAVDLGTDMLPAIALGAEKPTKDLMKRPPRPRGERLLNKKLLFMSYLYLGPIEAAAGLFGFFYVLNAGGWAWSESISQGDRLYMQATTVCLTAIIVTQVANVFVCRSLTQNSLRIGLFTNKLILAGIAVEITLQLLIVYTPFGNSIFNTRPLDAWMWLMLVPFAALLLIAGESLKFVYRKMAHGQTAPLPS